MAVLLVLPILYSPFLLDPSVTQLTNASQSGLDEFNPFSESSQLTNAARTTPAVQPSGHSQPAVLQTSVEPTPQAVAAAAQAGLLQQQAELERKAAELEKKERELQSNSASINREYCVLPAVAGMPREAWIAWSDSSFSFFVFFFVFFCQIAIYVIQAVGIPGWGDSGWIAALSEVRGNLAVAVIMMVVAAFFTLCAVLSLFLLKQVHSLYRRTGASFQRAQEEFSQGILSNRSFQNAAAGAASSAAQSAFRGN
ncbi:secretory carrier-associated membrane protein 2 [Pitangus sulphuratus]|nr:secretory carrier-associated membrane protein 2 [Pitangus sulphuratus]